MCLDSSDQGARMMVRSVYGSPDLRPSVSFRSGSYWSPPEDMGEAFGSGAWGPSPVLSLTPPASGPHAARFTLRAYGYNSESEIYNFYVDPYGRG
jgi:hypothetical protein